MKLMRYTFTFNCASSETSEILQGNTSSLLLKLNISQTKEKYFREPHADRNRTRNLLISCETLWPLSYQDSDGREKVVYLTSVVYTQYSYYKNIYSTFYCHKFGLLDQFHFSTPTRPYPPPRSLP